MVAGPCELCEESREAGVSCVPRRGGLRVPFGDEFHYLAFDPATGQPAPACPTCRTPRGGFHHAACRVEECPVCQGSAWRCGCARQAVVDGVPAQ